MATESTTDFSLDSAAAIAADEAGAIEGKSPWLLAWRRLRRNYVALGFLALFVLIVILCLLAGPYAHDIAKTGPNDNHLGETFTRDGKQVEVVSKGGFSGGTFKAGGIPVGCRRQSRPPGRNQRRGQDFRRPGADRSTHCGDCPRPNRKKPAANDGRFRSW